MVDAMTCIFVGSMERVMHLSSNDTRRYANGRTTVLINVSFDVLTDTIHEEIVSYDKALEMDGPAIEREYWIHDWERDVVDQYTKFIVKNILTLRGYC